MKKIIFMEIYRTMEYHRSFIVHLLFLLLGFCRCYEVNCDYLDTTQNDNTNYLNCHGNGCCGDFKHRHCCVGPIVIVASVFGALLGVLVIVVLVGYYYLKHYRTGHGKTIVSPEIQVTGTGFYDDVPLPSPLTSAPPVYSPHKLHPPLHTIGPFREVSNVDRNPPPVFAHSGRRP